MIPYLHFCPFFAINALIFCKKRHLFFAKKALIFCKKGTYFFAKKALILPKKGTYFFAKKALLFSSYFLQLIEYLFCVKLFSPPEIVFTNDVHVFLRILVTNLRVIFFDIYAIPTLCTPYYQSRLNPVSEICLVNLLTFSA